MNPRIEIDLKKIGHNTRVLVNMANKRNISVTGVTKVFCGMEKIAQVMADHGVILLADSRIENIKKLQRIQIPKLLLRLPMLSQIRDIVCYTDISLNSELSTIEALGQEALSMNKRHQIILMVDLGDLREGVLIEDTISTVQHILKIKGIQLIGIGTNLTCYGGVIPTEDNLGALASMAQELESRFSIPLKFISGGNSSSIYLLENNQIPKGVNNLRLGEAIVLGRETAFGGRIKDTHDDGFVLKAEIIELKEKPSVPMGEIGMDAFGNKPKFEDKGIRKRAILAVGKQDVSPDSIRPKDQNSAIIGASSDHLIMDVTQSDHQYRVGDEMAFKMDYGALLQIMSSEYVHKTILD